MKRSLILTAILTVLIGCSFFAIRSNAAVPYNSSKIVACYMSEDQTVGSSTWVDSVSGYDISLSGKKSTIGADGLNLESEKLYFNTNIVNTIKSKEFTIEIFLKDFQSKGSTYNTIINSSNDAFALYRKIDEDKLYFKHVTTDGKDDLKLRPTFAGALNKMSSDCLISVVFRYGVTVGTTKYSDICMIYVNGQLTSTSQFTDPNPGPDGNVKGTIGLADLFLGHSDGTKNFTAVVSSLRIYSRALSQSEIQKNYQVDLDRKYSLSNTPVKMYIENNVSDNRVFQFDGTTKKLINPTLNITLKGPVPNNCHLGITNVVPNNGDFSYGTNSRYAYRMSHCIEVYGSSKDLQTFNFSGLSPQNNTVATSLSEGTYYLVLYDVVTTKLLSWAQIQLGSSSRSYCKLSLTTTKAGLNKNFVPFDSAAGAFTSDVTVNIENQNASDMYMFVTEKRPKLAYYNGYPTGDNYYEDQMFLLYDNPTNRQFIVLPKAASLSYSFSELLQTNTYKSGSLGKLTPGKTYYLCVSSGSYLSACISFFVVPKSTSYSEIGIKLDNTIDGKNYVRKTINTIKETETVSVTGNVAELSGANIYFVITDVLPTSATEVNFCDARSYFALGFTACSAEFSTYSDIKIKNINKSLHETYQGVSLSPQNLETGKTYYLSLVFDSQSRSDYNSNGFVVDYLEFVAIDSEDRATSSGFNTIQVVVGNDLALRVTGGTKLNYYADSNWTATTKPLYSEFIYTDIVDYSVKFTINDKVNEVKADANNEFVLKGLKFTDMQAVVKIQLYKNGVLKDTVENWTVKSYLENDGTQKAKELLRLGSALLKYNGEEGFDVAGTFNTNPPGKPSVILNPTRTGDADYFFAGSLFLDDNVNLVFKYEYTNAVKLVITGEGQTVTITGEDLAKQRAESTDVYATGYGKEYVATLYDSNGAALSTVKYSVLTYIYDKYSEAEGTLKEVLDALLGLYRATGGTV